MLFMLAITVALPALAQVEAGGSRRDARTSAAVNESAAATQPTRNKLTFDAVSVRVSTRKFMFEGWDFLDSKSEEKPPKGGLFHWNIQFMELVSFAYDIRNSQTWSDVRQGLPKWAQDNWYAVEARAEGNPTRADVRAMVRSLLEERFQFAAHHEKRDGQIYALVVAKPGVGIKPHPEGAQCVLSSAQTDENKYPHVYPGYERIPAHCGIFNRVLTRVGERRLEMLNVTMQQMAEVLSEPVGGIDKTGLTGRYDAVLEFGPSGAERAPQTGEFTDEIGLPQLPVALEKQLGLKLVKQKAIVDVLVVDHIGTLSEN